MTMHELGLLRPPKFCNWLTA